MSILVQARVERHLSRVLGISFRRVGMSILVQARVEP